MRCGDCGKEAMLDPCWACEDRRFGEVLRRNIMQKHRAQLHCPDTSRRVGPLAFSIAALEPQKIWRHERCELDAIDLEAKRN